MGVRLKDIGGLVIACEALVYCLGASTRRTISPSFLEDMLPAIVKDKARLKDLAEILEKVRDFAGSVGESEIVGPAGGN